MASLALFHLVFNYGAAEIAVMIAFTFSVLTGMVIAFHIFLLNGIDDENEAKEIQKKVSGSFGWSRGTQVALAYEDIRIVRNHIFIIRAGHSFGGIFFYFQ